MLGGLVFSRVHTVRVTYPTMTAGAQTSEVATVALPLTGAPTVTHVATISESGADVMQVAVGEAGSRTPQVPGSLQNFDLGFATGRRLDPSNAHAITWKRYTLGGPLRERGAFIDQTTGALGPAFDISPTSWPNSDKSGDF